MRRMGSTDHFEGESTAADGALELRRWDGSRVLHNPSLPGGRGQGTAPVVQEASGAGGGGASPRAHVRIRPGSPEIGRAHV